MNDQQKNTEEEEKMDPWTAWIIDHGGIKEQRMIGKTSYDKLLEMAVDHYELDRKDRKQVLKDQQQFLCLWWINNLRFFTKYKTYLSVGKLLKKDHATILHTIKRRKPSNDYDNNTADIKDFLES